MTKSEHDFLFWLSHGFEAYWLAFKKTGKKHGGGIRFVVMHELLLYIDLVSFTVRLFFFFFCTRLWACVCGHVLFLAYNIFFKEKNSIFIINFENFSFCFFLR